MGLSSIFVIIPPPSRWAHRANDCLPAGVNVHVLDGNFLLPLPSIALQCLGLGGEGSQKFHREISVAVLLGYHVRALQTAQRTCRSEMRRNHPDCQHRLDFVVGADLMNRREYSVDVLLTWRITGGPLAKPRYRVGHCLFGGRHRQGHLAGGRDLGRGQGPSP
jgi:hypothetical protein